MIGVLVYYKYSERAYFSLINDACIILIGQHLRKLCFFIDFFLNSDSSVTIYAIEMISPVSLLKVLLEGSVSQIFDIGPRFYFVKNRVTFCHFLSNFYIFIFYIS